MIGVSIINDCKYGYNVHDGVIGISLLKSPIHPNPAADKEKHEFIYSIYPHVGGWKDASTVQHAYSINNPMIATLKAPNDGKLPQEMSFISVEAENVIIEVVKRAEVSDDIIIRLYEFYNQRTNTTIESSLDIETVWECNMLENNLEQIKIINNRICFEIKPYEIKTFKIKIKS